MNKCQVTIAIPVFNVELYIEKSLLSALNQDFEHFFEVLIIDDCGSDNSMKIIRKVLEANHRNNIVRIVKHESNKGLGPARNTAINNANGKYLFFLDSDDWISSDCISILYDKAEKTGSDVTVGSIVRIDEKSKKKIGDRIYPNKTIETEAAGIYMINHAPDMHIEVWNKLYKTDFLKKNNIKCVHRIFEDYNFDFIMRSTALKITLCSDITLYYNIRSNSILTSLKAKGTTEAAQTLCDIISTLQILVTNLYSNVAGIYDLYFQRAIWVMENLNRYSFCESDNQYIHDKIKGYCSFVPNASLLNNPKHAYIYKRCKDNESLENFVFVNNQSNRIINKVIFKIIKLLQYVVHI